MRSRWNWRHWPWAALGIALGAAPALAHEKWFVSDEQLASVAARPSVFTGLTAFGLVATVIVAGFFVLMWEVDRRLDGTALAHRLDEWLQRLPMHPRTILGTVIGVSLMGAGLQGTLFSPNLQLPATAWGAALGVAEIVIGTALIFLEPLYAELGAMLAVLFFLGFSVEPFWNLLEELLFLGAGLYLVTQETRRSPWSRWATEETRRLGFQAFRLIVGLNFLVLSFVKWLRPDLAMALVEQYRVNFLPWAGVDTAEFVFLAALIETVVALCLLFRVAFRTATVVALFFFTASIFVFGFRELLGHLPIKAALILFFIIGHWHKGERKA
jgi:hypothetical protein